MSRTPTSSRWQRIDAIFQAARTRSPEERLTFLNAECENGEELREVLKLLATEVTVREGRPEDIGAGAALQPGSPPWPLKTDRIGPYRILQLLGEGGMGVVYLAEQTEPMQREVALKVIRASGADRRLAHRFEAERQALARMNHPNIAQVYDAGDTEAGEPYVVMELVPGEPITRYCDAHLLTLDERLELFASACDGVQHAHQKGLLHRDLKPANILVTEPEGGPPVAKIIDFGIAKALDRPLVDGTLTEAGVIGTPAYLSPEAIRAAPESSDIDTRSDVYSLGVVLYELLVGVQPFKRQGDSFFHMLERVQTEDVLPPSQRLAVLDDVVALDSAAVRRVSLPTLRRQLRGDLDWITVKAMARERDERYDSAAGLAADVRRHLESVPVLAAAPSRAYRVRKFVRRHGAGVAAALLVVAALVGGLVARTVEARRANREAEVARRAQEETTEVVEFLLRLFEVSDPNQSQGETITAHELLDRGAERIRTDLRDQPGTRARLLDTIGVVYQKLGLYGQSASALEEALRLWRESGERQKELASTLSHLGELHWLQASYERAEAYYREALEIATEIGGPQSLAAAKAMDDLGSLYEVTGRFEEAEPLFLQALDLRERHLGERDLDVAASLDDLAVLYLDSGRPADAEPLARRVLSIREELLGADHTEVAGALNTLAGALYGQNLDTETIPLLRRALAIREARLGDGHPDVGQSLFNLANAYHYLGERDMSGPLFERAAAIWEEALGERHYRVGIALHGLAELRAEEGKVEEAEALYRKAASIVEESLGSDHPRLAFPSKALADLLRDGGRYDEAEELYRRALAIRTATLDPQAGLLVTTREAYAVLLRTVGREEEAAAVMAGTLP